MRRALVSAALLACVIALAADASATVYTWVDDGVRHFTNFAHEVPEPHRATAKSFPTAPPVAAPPDTPEPARESEASAVEATPLEAYERGVERGAAVALAQTRAVGQLAESLVETALRSADRSVAARAPLPAAPEQGQRTRREPAFRVSIVPAGYRWPGVVGYGSVGVVAGCAGCCCAPGLGYGFGSGRLVPHSHFWPSLAGARRAPLFFPDGHQLDANLFLTGRGYWLD